MNNVCMLAHEVGHHISYSKNGIGIDRTEYFSYERAGTIPPFKVKLAFFNEEVRAWYYGFFFLKLHQSLPLLSYLKEAAVALYGYFEGIFIKG